MALTDKLTAIADAIRSKSKKNTRMTLEEMPAHIEALQAEELLPAIDLPDYVKIEAAMTAAQVCEVLCNDSIVSIHLSDSHYVGETATSADSIQNDKSNIHACMAIKALTYLLPIDYIAHHGDVGSGTAADNNAPQQKQIGDYLKYFREAAGKTPVFVALGNQDSGVYHSALSGNWLYNNFTALSESEDTVVSGKGNGGYCYRDFPNKKLRVFLLNTSEALIATHDKNNDTGCLESQHLWVAQALKNLNSKADAASWGFVVLSHYPLDYADAWKISRVFTAYVNGESITLNGTTVHFSGSNAAKFYAQFHGHFHCFRSDNLYGSTSNDPWKMRPYNVYRLCTPNAGYNAENTYEGQSYYNITYDEDIKYEKTPNTENDTSFVINVITPSEDSIHSFCYGNGYDRTMSLTAPIHYRVIKNLTFASVKQESATPVDDGAGYSCTIDAKTGCTMDSVVITMGGVDITSSVYDASTGAVTIPTVTGTVSITAVALVKSNLVPIAQEFTQGSSSILDGIGYRDGYYHASSGGIGGAASGYVCTGLIPYAKKADGTFPTIYVKGCEWGNNDSNCRIYFYNASKTVLDTERYGGPANDADVAVQFAITKLDNQYYSFDATTNMDTVPYEVAYFAISLKGSGNDLIITLDEPIGNINMAQFTIDYYESWYDNEYEDASGDYSYEDGMTWREWCDSLYNTCHLKVCDYEDYGKDGAVFSIVQPEDGSSRCLRENDSYNEVQADDFIYNGRTYSVSSW